VSGFSHEFSEPVLHNTGARDLDPVELEWTRRGRTMTSLVSDVLIEEIVAAENQRRALLRAGTSLVCLLLSEDPYDPTDALEAWRTAVEMGPS
jgi:hypothetical protein